VHAKPSATLHPLVCRLPWLECCN